MDVSIGGIRFQCVGLELELGERLRVQLTLQSVTGQVLVTGSTPVVDVTRAVSGQDINNGSRRHDRPRHYQHR